MATPQARTLSCTQQALALRARFPQATLKVKAGRLEWTSQLQPTTLSRTYPVRIAYQQSTVPRVRILERLQVREGAPLPHVFSDGTLCLHQRGEWHGQMWIVSSTVPWTSEWLFYYELWLATGDWYGGGEWPPARSPSVKPPL